MNRLRNECWGEDSDITAVGQGWQHWGDGHLVRDGGDAVARVQLRDCTADSPTVTTADGQNDKLVGINDGGVVKNQ